MKPLFLSLAFFLLVNYAQATIRRCNNNPNVTGTYTTAQAAHDAANPGDTIHLEPSTNGNYGTLTISKRITLIGTGDFLSAHPGNQVNFYPSGYCSTVNIQQGSDSSVISAKVSGNINIYQSNNITISNTICGGIYFVSNSPNPLNGLTIVKSDIGSITESGGVTNMTVIRNNRVGSISLGTGCSVILAYNTLFMGGFYSCQLYNSILSNNIFIHGGYLYYAPTFTNCNLFDNIASENWLPTSNGNLNNVVMTSVFSNILGSPGNYSFTADNCQLLPSYPNQNLGMFAGSDPYRLALMPPVPSIYELTVPATSGGNILNITVSTKSNN